MAFKITLRFFSNPSFLTIPAGILIFLLTIAPAYAYSSTFTDSTGGWYQTVSYSSQKTTSLSHSISFGDVISITGNNHPVSRIRYFSGACTGVYCAGSVVHTVYPGTNNYAVPYYEGAQGIVIDANAYVYFTSGSGLVNPNPPPETDFYANLTTGNLPLAVQFNDSSSNDPDTFFWQFGDGQESAEKDPVIVYTDSGTYTVRHSATNGGGTTWKNVTGYISVQNATQPPQNITYYAEYWNLPNDFELLTYPGGYAGLVADCAGLGGTASSGYQRVYVYGETGQVLNYYASDTNGVVKGPCGEYPWHNIAVGFSPNGSAVAYDMCMNGMYPKIAYHPGNPPIVVMFNATPTTGSAPLTVQFNDTSTGAPTSWTWDFGDGTNATMQHPLHTYEATGNYTILHSATNALGSRWKNITDYITVTNPAPVANFTATPTSGPAPLTVQFNDTSIGTPTNWTWEFGDGNTSTGQNPSHTYEAAGTYTVNLTAANAAGSDTVVKEGYISVTGGGPAQTDFYVYAESVGLYYGTQDDLTMGNTTPGEFYNAIKGKCGTVDNEKCWNGRGLYTDDDAGSVHWSSLEQAGNYADNADFSVFVGHGWDNGIVFGTPNSSLELERQQMSFGGSKAKWVSIFACDVLNQSTQTNWESVFNGVHIVNGFDTHGLLFPLQGSKYAQMLTGIGGGYDRKPIKTAWKEMLKETINKNSIKGASMWVEPCGNDYLPGFGEYFTPIKNGQGDYTFVYENFNCSYA